MSTMRRNNLGYQPLPQSSNAATIEEQNNEIEEVMKGKIQILKDLTIEIGNEVKDHNKFLNGLDDDFERSRGFLSRTMGRVVQLGKGSHNYYLLYLFFFSLTVFFIIWMLIR